MKLPALPLDSWENTKITLHLYLQIIGKIKLALAVRKNHWWHITLLPHVSGLTTGWIPGGDQTFQIVTDMVRHELRIEFSNGNTEAFHLKDGLSVAQFYKELMNRLETNDIRPQIKAEPYDHPCQEPFAECQTYASYDHAFIERFHHVLQFTTRVFDKFRAQFTGKVSPVQLYWHHMDLAVTRFSGRKAGTDMSGSSAADRDAYSHEVISAGFWAGDEQVRGAAYYSYTFPSPEGIQDEKLKPEPAWWEMSSGSPMAMLMYDDLLKESDPEHALLAFLETSYLAGTISGHWPEEEMLYRIP